MAVIKIGEYEVLIDEDDVEKVTSFKWYIDRGAIKRGNYYFRRCYVVNKGRQSTISLHRFIMGCTLGDGKVVDHINHNTLDNRKQNLRICDRFGNSRNTKISKHSPYGYKGVNKYHKGGRFYAQLNRRINGKIKKWNLGLYDKAEDAARAYDKAALFVFGEFAYTNFSREHYTEDEINTFFINLYPEYNNYIAS